MTVEANDYLARNRAAWDVLASEFAEPGHRRWRENRITWGNFGAPEEELHVLPPVDGLDVIELGCGTGYVSSWLARRGARPVGIDNSPKQLESARRFQDEFGVAFPLILGNAEEVPFPDESFDLAISEYGAAIWCDPYKWIPEAARLLRGGGQLIFLGNSILLMLCVPDYETETTGNVLLRDQFGMHRFEWPDDVAVDFHITHGDMIRLLRKSGFEIENLIEVKPPPEAVTRRSYMPVEWARRWPAEEIWIARKKA